MFLCITRASLFVLALAILCFVRFPFVVVLVVSATAINNCLEKLVSEMTYYVWSGTLNPTHSVRRVECRFDAHRVTENKSKLLIYFVLRPTQLRIPDRPGNEW